MGTVVTDDEDEEEDLEDGESDEALVEGGLHVWLTEDDNGGQVPHQPNTANHRDGDLPQYELGPGFHLSGVETGTFHLPSLEDFSHYIYNQVVGAFRLNISILILIFLPLLFLEASLI